MIILYSIYIVCDIKSKKRVYYGCEDAQLQASPKAFSNTDCWSCRICSLVIFLSLWFTFLVLIGTMALVRCIGLGAKFIILYYGWKLKNLSDISHSVLKSLPTLDASQLLLLSWIFVLMFILLCVIVFCKFYNFLFLFI